MELAEAFCERTGWHPAIVRSFAGALMYSRYGFVKRRMMQRIAAQEGAPTDASRDWEYTDWDDVADLADEVGALAGAVLAAR